MNSGFSGLTPHLLIDGVENFTGDRYTGHTNPLTSYINRVYEVEREDGVKMIVKYYRPGRWTLDAIYDEHDFIFDCLEDEIPVVAPVELNNDSTVALWDEYAFALFPKKSGPMLEINSDDEWIRAGELIGRIHRAGARFNSEYRMKLDPENSTEKFVENLLFGGLINEANRKPFEAVCRKIIKTIKPLFADFETIRVHGDCHRGNIIHRPGEGLMIIDFDDMGTAVPVQDLWMLLPGRLEQSRREMNLLLEGYETFRDFDYRSLKLIEPLRAMRIIYYIEWCSLQVGEHHFVRNNPDWGTDIYWRNEINDLEVQCHEILDALKSYRGLN
ncbi:serine/threonine protein kinase [Spirochaeta isovalerica]|uniref:Ser/Thr protein kinase RdoA (MazF antagonist) n=1 Tax=Spirochaeta isovalerica TaxID=150 RepID=A0A841R9M2_9SPIO|nr:serine/threonine protein kinase [Spirochaeta isovalerica]MBB6482044.1 Ser/Thr protein kinase RdoA (MazF antagonist) [Spirochaeta isovalerica]